MAEDNITLQLDPSFGQAGQPIDEAEALRILMARLPQAGADERNLRTHANPDERRYPRGSGAERTLLRESRRRLAQEVLAALPAELRTREVLEQGDLRSLMTLVAYQPVRENYEDDVVRLLAGAVMQSETDRLRDTLTEQLSTITQDQTIVPDLLDEMLYGYRDGRIMRTPQVVGGAVGRDPTTGQVVASPDASPALQSAVGEFNTDNLGPTLAQQIPYMTREQAEFLFRNSDYDAAINVTLRQEEELATLRDAGMDSSGQPVTVTGSALRVDYDRSQREREMRQQQAASPRSAGRIQNQDTRRGGQYTLTEIINMPSTMSRGEVMNMTRRMERAGVFDMVGGKPFTRGDATDSRFKAAWKLLIGKAVESGTDIVSVLGNMQESYEAEMDAAMVTQLTDPARVRLSADSLGQRLLGRRLSPQEHAQMVSFVHNLERKNAQIMQGVESGDVEGDQIVADIEARLEEYIQAQNPGEAGAKDVANQYEVFASLLSGPGRGTT